MKKFLSIMRDFPGLGGGIAVPLMRHVRLYGCEPVIITNKSRYLSHPAFRDEDDTSSLEAHAVLCLNKSPFGALSRWFGLRGVASYLDKFLFVPDMFITCLPFALSIGKRILGAQRIDTILTISPPESVHMIGMLLSRSTGARWIADFEDLWTTRKVVYSPPTPLHDRFIRRIEKAIYERADHLIANTYGNKQVYINDFNIPESKITVIHGGYDPKDVAGNQTASVTQKNAAFSIGYMGRFDKPGYAWKELLLALKKLLDLGGDVRVKLNICGHVGPDARRLIEDNHLKEHVVCHGTFPHPEAVKMIRRNDLLVVTHVEADYSVNIVPCKLYHYLGMGKRILAVARSDGEVASIIEKTNTGDVVSAKKPDAIYNALVGYYQQWQALGVLDYNRNHDGMKEYDITAMAGRLAGVIKGN